MWLGWGWGGRLRLLQARRGVCVGKGYVTIRENPIAQVAVAVREVYVWNRLYKIYILYSKLIVFVLEAAYLSNRLLPPKIDGQTLNGYDSSLPGEISCILTLATNSTFALVSSNGECTMAEIERYQLSNPNININIVSFITTL